MANYGSYYLAVKGWLDISTVLAAALDPSATQADHVRLERYSCISKDGPLNHDAQLDLGPNIYLIPSSCEYSSVTEQHGKDEAFLEMDVHSRVINAPAAATTFVSHIRLVDDLCVAMMHGADGTGGTSSWLSPYGIKLRCSSAMPEQLSMTECRTKVKIRAQLLPVY